MAAGLLLAGCATVPPPQNTSDICDIYQQYPKWYAKSLEIQDKWGLKPNVMMAIIYQESSFRGNAAPPRKKLLWIIPWRRPTSAYGYSQAVNGTWKDYQADTGKNSASRSAFDDAADFIGWFTTKAHQKLGISMNDAYHQYLAYHEGFGGYMRHSYAHQQWLLNVAHKVEKRSQTYAMQLQDCHADLDNMIDR